LNSFLSWTVYFALPALPWECWHRHTHLHFISEPE
jgi:hypothetical protein